MKIKTKLMASLGFSIFFIFCAMLAQFYAQNKNSAQISAAEVRYLSFLLADEFRHSSIDLTRLARSYAATADISYFDKYFDIVNWRNGDAPRPAEVNKKLHPGKNISIREIMTELGFSKIEMSLLDEAIVFSDTLINTETQAMNSVKNDIYADGPYRKLPGENNRDFAIRILFDSNYENEVEKIMKPVNAFFNELDKRTADQLKAASETARYWLGVALLLQVITGIVLLQFLWFMTRRLFKPLDIIVNSLSSVDIGNGEIDLSVSLNENEEYELSNLARSFNLFSARVKNLLKQFEHATEQLTTSSRNLLQISKQTDSAVVRQQIRLDQVATAVNEMVATVQDVAKSAGAASSAAHSSLKEGKAGLEIVDKTIASMSSLAQHFKTVTDSVSNLESDSNTISSVLEVIKSIADQTNLLALNAAIEAARAGDQGRGFSVVADEVRSLAKRTQDSTAQIQIMISGLQQNSKVAVDAITFSNAQAEQCMLDSGQAGEYLNRISYGIGNISDMNSQIAAATEQQSIVIEDINRNIHEILGEVNCSAEAASETSGSSETLKCITEDLGALIKKFKLN